jgi:cytochrome c oxidase assembly protein subunit 11
MTTPTEADHKSEGAARRRRWTAVACVVTVAGMAGMAFAAVPLYRLFCQATGYGGTPVVGRGPSSSVADRVVAVRFDANVAPGLAWRFAPETPEIAARLGETKTVFYRITNTGRQAATGIATFNVVPEQSGPFFVKIQCFCFEEQTLEAGETIEAPVAFYIDPALAGSADLGKLGTITLSYTIFPAKTLPSASPRPLATTERPRDKPKL